MGPLTIIATNMTDTEVDRAIDDAKCADQEIFIRDGNDKVFTDNNTNSNTLEDNLENSDLSLASNLSSSTEIDTEEKNPIRRSTRLTKTNPNLNIIIRFVMITGNTVKRLNSGQPAAQPEGKEDNL